MIEVPELLGVAWRSRCRVALEGWNGRDQSGKRRLGLEDEHGTCKEDACFRAQTTGFHVPCSSGAYSNWLSCPDPSCRDLAGRSI